MALSGIQIYKLLPQTNCKECGFPTCLAFAMKLAAKQVELSACPYVSDESKEQLAASSAPPIRLVTLKAGTEVKAGNEVVMFRHEKTFYNKPGLFIRVKASDGDIAAKVGEADKYIVNYVGMDFTIDGFAVEADGGDFAAAVKTVRGASQRPLILIGDVSTLPAGLEACSGETPMIYAADASNWEAMADLAAKYKAALAVKGESLDELAELTEKIKAKGVEDMVLDLGGANMAEWLTRSTQVRRLAIKKNFRALGYPVIAFPGDAGEIGKEFYLRGAGHLQIRWLRSVGYLHARISLRPAGTAREHLHRPAETHPGAARHLRNQQSDRRRTRTGHHQLQHHLLLGGQRSRRLWPARLAGRDRRRRHVRADGLGGWQVRFRTHRQSCQGIRRG